MTSHTSKTSIGWCEVSLKKSPITDDLRLLLTTGSFEALFEPEGLKTLMVKQSSENANFATAGIYAH
jgi:hypothetical protein